MKFYVFFINLRRKSKRGVNSNRIINLFIECLFVIDSTVYNNLQLIYGSNIPIEFLNSYIKIIYTHIINGVLIFDIYSIITKSI